MSDPARWAFLNPETGDWIEVKPGTVILAASQPPSGDALREALIAALPTALTYSDRHPYDLNVEGTADNLIAALATPAPLDVVDITGIDAIEKALIERLQSEGWSPAPLDGPTVAWVGNPLAEEPRAAPAPLDVDPVRLGWAVFDVATSGMGVNPDRPTAPSDLYLEYGAALARAYAEQQPQATGKEQS